MTSALFTRLDVPGIFLSDQTVSWLCPSFRRLDADLVCIIGEIQVKVIGKVRTGELIYTCPSDKFPGTATASHELGNYATQDREVCQ